MKVGDVVTLKCYCLGNPIGTKGVIFNEYEDFDVPNRMGVTIIFENGNYDGFSVEEQEVFLEKKEMKYISQKIISYKFENVMKVSDDYRNGCWDEIFK